MNVEVVGNPDFGTVHFSLAKGDKVLVESGAMAAMDADIGVNTQMMGGFIPAVMRKFLAGESLLMGEYTASADGQRLQISPGIPGMVIARKMVGAPLFLQAGSFLACTPGIQMATVFGGLRALFSGEGMFFLKVSGEGELWLNAYGAIIEKDLEGELIVDTGHVVGWTEGLTWSVEGMGNLMSTLFSGEGLVLRFKGTGKVWLQTRSVGGLVNWMRGYVR